MFNLKIYMYIYIYIYIYISSRFPYKNQGKQASKKSGNSSKTRCIKGCKVVNVIHHTGGMKHTMKE